MKLPTITFGIPAYNEAHMLPPLVTALLKQDLTGLQLKDIIIVSDGSTDNTAAVVQALSDPHIDLMINNERRGKAHCQDRIFQKADADIVVVLDADTMIKQRQFIKKLITPVLTGNADLTAAQIEELPPATFLGRILAASMHFKKRVYYQYKAGHNVYTCCGRARAFSKKLYTSISFKQVGISEDAYSYFFCMREHMRYEPAPQAEIWYHLPATWEDHKRQSVRFFASKKELMTQIKQKEYESVYHLPNKLLLQSFLHFLIREPIILFYFPILIYYKLTSYWEHKKTALWDIASSSKKRYEKK